MEKRKRYLNDTITNLHKKFCTNHFNISFTMFYKLKPFWVVKLKISALETCLCKDHENFDFMFKNCEVKDVFSFIDALCCHSNKKDCMLRYCVTIVVIYK